MEKNKKICRYGVSGVGKRQPKLERLWDSVGKTAVPGTDQAPAHSDFDGLPPFERRKCVGYWTKPEGKKYAVFHVQAYLGETGYTEDGSLGNYVAVEVTPFYWYHDEKKGVLGVSPNCTDEGWTIHPICLDPDGHVRPYTYLPAYELALDSEGLPVSLPGYHPHFGTYYGLRSAARKYLNGAVGECAVLETTALWHYNYLLMLIEFATQNMQECIYGACNMRYAPDPVIAVPGENLVVVSAEAGDIFVPGQTIYFSAYFKDHPAGIDEYNILSEITHCDADGALNADGAFRRLTYLGPDRSENIQAGVTQIASRPWITGVCVGSSPYVQPVKGHTGSPVSNTSGIYPMLYRWMENVYSNINKNCVDLMNSRCGETEDDVYLEWYYLPEPASYMPTDDRHPNPEDLHKYWVKLSVKTGHESYVNGYIKTFETDPRFPFIQIPTETVGGSGDTYYCDWADLVLTHAVRSIRRGGSMYSHDHYGPCFMSANGDVAHGGWYYGARLFMVQ